MWFSLFVLVCVLVSQASADCFTSENSVEDFVQCLQSAYFHTTTGSLTESQWQTMLPNDAEVQAFRDLIQSTVASGECIGSIPSAIVNSVQVRSFSLRKESHCVIMEQTDQLGVNGKFARGWPLVLIAQRDCNKGCTAVHHSAPHTKSDTNTDVQAAAIYEQSKGATLVVSTVRRDAVDVPSDCQPNYHPADGAHDTSTMFHHAAVAIYDWQSTHGCTPDVCAYMQWHGKGSSTCPDDSVFLSVGAYGSDAVYADESAVVNRFRTALLTVWQSVDATHTARTAAESSCGLVARTNVLGRVINNVADANVCPGPSAQSATGEFIHVEQMYSLRNNNDEIKRIADAVALTFTTAAGGKGKGGGGGGGGGRKNG